MKLGETYYVIAHSYYHYVGKVVGILAGDTVVLDQCVRIHSCARGFTDFFEHGFLNDTVFSSWPNGTEVSGAFIKAPWHHEIPWRKKSASPSET